MAKTLTKNSLIVSLLRHRNPAKKGLAQRRSPLASAATSPSSSTAAPALEKILEKHGLKSHEEIYKFSIEKVRNKVHSFPTSMCSLYIYIYLSLARYVAVQCTEQ